MSLATIKWVTKGAKASAAALPSSKVTMIYLNENEIGDEGTKALSGCVNSDGTIIRFLHMSVRSAAGSSGTARPQV